LKNLNVEFGIISEKLNDNDKYILSRMNKTIKTVTEEMESFRVSLAIGNIMQFVNDAINYSKMKYDKKILGECIKNICLLLSAIAPHLTEEVWDAFNLSKDISKDKKDEVSANYCSMAQWPSYHDSLIDEAAESSKETVDQTISDIRSILKLIKKENPVKITLFVAEEWKYDFFKKLKETLEKTHNIGEIMKAVMMTEFKKEISSIVPIVVKDQSKLPQVVLTQEREFESLAANVDKLKSAFDCEFDIIKAESSSEQKAKKALPGKPSLIVE